MAANLKDSGVWGCMIPVKGKVGYVNKNSTYIVSVFQMNEIKKHHTYIMLIMLIIIISGI